MSNPPTPKKKKIIAQYINENLKEVFADYANDEMPLELVDLLSVLKAQDEELDKD